MNRPDRLDDGGHPGVAVRGAAVRHGQGGVPVRAGGPAVAASDRRRGRVQPGEARRRRAPRLQPQVHHRLLLPQRQGRLGLPGRRAPLLHRHGGPLCRPRLLQHPHLPRGVPQLLPGDGGQHLIRVHARCPLLAHLRSHAGGVGDRQGPAHGAPVPGPALHPGGEPPARRGRLRCHTRRQDQRVITEAHGICVVLVMLITTLLLML
jgi:hypothetical protein